jgi:osmotically inducible protein OsmC
MTAFTRKASASWDGELTKGKGHISLGSGAFSGPYSFNSRFGEEKATNPEELIGAAHAGCFTMALSAALTGSGKPPQHLETNAEVTIEKDAGGFTIREITLTTVGVVPGMTAEQFLEMAEAAKATCPVSRALTGVKITLSAKLQETSVA